MVQLIKPGWLSYMTSDPCTCAVSLGSFYIIKVIHILVILDIIYVYIRLSTGF